MSEPAPRVFPKSSAFEALLARAYLELWDLQDDPVAFSNRVEKFARVWLPSMFREKLREKLPDLEARFNEMHKNIALLKKMERETDPYTADAIEKGSIPAQEADFAEEVWHAVMDVLTDAGFNFPVGVVKPRHFMRA